MMIIKSLFIEGNTLRYYNKHYILFYNVVFWNNKTFNYMFHINTDLEHLESLITLRCIFLTTSSWFHHREVTYNLISHKNYEMPI